MAMEQWLPICDYEGHYEISDLGRVKSFKRGRERILKPMLIGRPKYCAVALHKGGVRNVRKIHHLVLETFVGERPPGMMGLHDNDVSTDNRLENLSWGTGSENQCDSVRNQRHANSVKTRCRNNHPLAGENLYVTPEGERQCRECNRQAVRTYRQRKLQAANA